jgi:ABC-type transport system involved in cytochrome c biogenesis permease subunit
LLKAIGAIFFGAVIGFLGVILHNAFQPVGILLALLTTGIGINFAGQLFGKQRYKVFAALAWLAVALRAGTYGASNEILVISNLYGNIFLLGGLLAGFIAVIKRR